MKDSEVIQFIDQVLHDPLLLRKLSDRVYRLFQEEQWNQNDREKKH